MPIINNLAGGEVEITKLADILTGTDYDITDVYYGDLNIFTVWDTTEGALPRTFSANGDSAVEWQIYGGVDEGANLFDNDTYVNNAYKFRCTAVSSQTGITITSTGNDPYIGRFVNAQTVLTNSDIKALVKVKPNTTYTLNMSTAPKCIISMIKDDFTSAGGNSTVSQLPYTFTTGVDVKYIYLRFGDENLEVGQALTFADIMLNAGSTALPYTPYSDSDRVGQRTENLCTNEFRMGTRGDLNDSIACCLTVTIPVTQGDTFTIKNFKNILKFDVYLLNAEQQTQWDATMTARGTAPYESGWVNTSITKTVTEQDAVSIGIMVRYRTGEMAFNLSDALDSITITVGSTAPTAYIPYGYKIPVNVRGRNLFDGTLVSTTTMGVTFKLDNDGYMYASPTNSDTRGWTYAYSQIKVTLPSGNYALCLSGTPSTSVGSGIRVNDDADKNLGNKGAINGQSTVIINFAVTDNHNIGIVAKIHDGRFRVQLLEGTYTTQTIPPYEPYINTTTNLYLGGSQLQPEEYTSYKDQKIYKYVSGVLTPTDPPVPIPALPTLNGVTVVDTELASSEVQPEKTLVKFRKMNS